jgi:hypothetical protein
MSPKEKAKQIYNAYYYMSVLTTSENAKKCALYTVNEILNANPTWFINPLRPTHKFWEQVKQEIENIK